MTPTIDAKPEQTRMTAEELAKLSSRWSSGVAGRTESEREMVAAIERSLAHIAALESELAARPAADQYTQEQREKDAKDVKDCANHYRFKGGLDAERIADRFDLIAARLAAPRIPATAVEGNGAK